MATPLKRAQRSLAGLSVGDAFGERYFGPSGVMFSRIAGRVLPEPPWTWTDDTAMARVVYVALERWGGLPSNGVSRAFAQEYQREPGRGYGTGAAGILNEICSGKTWQTASSLAFGGSGSYGNGAAMRSAPIGAYFAEDLEALVEHTTQASQVTHFHPDGIAGAVAVALAAAYCAQPRSSQSLLEFVAEHTPPGPLRRAVLRASELPLDTKPSQVAKELGNGKRVTALDTVPFCLWMAQRRNDSFEEAMWETVGVLGDRDTTCAIVGGIVASSPQVMVPEHWLRAREPLNLEAVSLKEG